MSELLEAGFLHPQIFVLLIMMPGLLLLFPLCCACGGGSRRGSRLVEESKLVSLLEVGLSAMEVDELLGPSDEGHQGGHHQGRLALVVKAGTGSCHQGGVTKADSRLGHGWQSYHRSSWFWVIGASLVGQVLIAPTQQAGSVCVCSILRRQVRSGLVPCPASRSCRPVKW
jgi:hypothetical protein